MSTMASRRVAITVAVVVVVMALLSAATADDRLKKMIKARGTVSVKLIECHVPDLDPYPAQGDSDVFARVTVNNVTLCESPVVQDTNKPKFEALNCTSKEPVKGDAVIRVDLFDSDKPAEKPDFIGSTNISIADLIFNRRLDSQENYSIEGQKYPKHYLRAQVSFKPLDIEP